MKTFRYVGVVAAGCLVFLLVPAGGCKTDRQGRTATTRPGEPDRKAQPERARQPKPERKKPVGKPDAGDVWAWLRETGKFETQWTHVEVIGRYPWVIAYIEQPVAEKAVLDRFGKGDEVVPLDNSDSDHIHRYYYFTDAMQAPLHQARKLLGDKVLRYGTVELLLRKGKVVVAADFRKPQATTKPQAATKPPAADNPKRTTSIEIAGMLIVVNEEDAPRISRLMKYLTSGGGSSGWWMHGAAMSTICYEPRKPGSEKALVEAIGPPDAVARSHTIKLVSSGLPFRQRDLSGDFLVYGPVTVFVSKGKVTYALMGHQLDLKPAPPAN